MVGCPDLHKIIPPAFFTLLTAVMKYLTKATLDSQCKVSVHHGRDGMSTGA